jgi:hypothetical protein
MSSPKRTIGTLSEASRAAVERFVTATTARGRLEALRTLKVEKQVALAREQPGFAESIALCASVAVNVEGPDTERIHAIAALAFARVVHAWEDGALSRHLAAALSEPPPTASLLQNKDDRMRILLAVRDLRPPWGISYALPHTLDESSELRRTALAVVLAVAQNFEHATQMLAEELDRGGAKLAASVFARTALGVLTDLVVASAEVSLVPGDHPAAGVVRFAEALRAHEIRSLGTSDQRQLTELLARLVRRVGALRLRLALDPATYEPLVLLRAALGQHWTVVAWHEGAEALALARADAAEALYVQVRAGVPDAALRGVVEALHPDDAHAARALAALAREPGLSEEMVRWLTDAPELADDVVRSVAGLKAEGERDVLASLVAAAATLDDWRFENPAAVVVPWDTVEGLQHTVQALTGRRGLLIGGRPGDTVRFDPVRHEVTHVPPGGLGRVRLTTPIVLETRADGTTIVVRKAIVEPVD